MPALAATAVHEDTGVAAEVVAAQVVAVYALPAEAATAAHAATGVGPVVFVGHVVVV